MGGRAFFQAAADGHETLNVVRMGPEDYEHVKTICLRRLEKYFPGCKVQSLKEAPGKKDYGDLDLIVCSQGELDYTHLATALGARGVIWDDSDSIRRCVLAVPKDGSKHPGPAIRYRSSKTKLNSHDQLSVAEYVQVDVELIGPERFAWVEFYTSYGDMATILGQILHNHGFTVSDKGLFLRLRELEDFKAIDHVNIPDSAGCILLSNDPVQVMEFLGLDRIAYEAEFATLDAFFEWLSKCRLLTAHYVDNMLYKRKENSSQRQKDEKRPMIRHFFEVFLPQQAEFQAQSEQAEYATEDIRRKWQEAAVDFFKVPDEYARTREALIRAKKNQTAVHLLKPIIAFHSGIDKPKKLNELLRAFRRWVDIDDNRQAKVRAVPQSDDQSQLHRWLDGPGDCFEDEAMVSAWVGTHWDGLKSLERGKVDARHVP